MWFFNYYDQAIGNTMQTAGSDIASYLSTRSRKDLDRVQDSYEEQDFWMTRLYLVGIRLNQF